MFEATKGWLSETYNDVSKKAPDLTYWATAGLGFLLSYKVTSLILGRMGWGNGMIGGLLALGVAFWAAKEGGAAQYKHALDLQNGGGQREFNNKSGATPPAPNPPTPPSDQTADNSRQTATVASPSGMVPQR